MEANELDLFEFEKGMRRQGEDLPIRDEQFLKFFASLDVFGQDIDLPMIPN